MSFFAEWRKELPSVAGSLTTALVIFVVSTIAYRFRGYLYPPYEGLEYPLTCTAEAYPDLATGNLNVEFYIFNHTDRSLSEDDLISALHDASKGTDAVLSPVIDLKYWREVGRVETAHSDAAFNGDKGNLAVAINDEAGEKRAVSIHIRDIKSYAILRAVIVVSGLTGIENITRATKVDIPLDFHPYEKGCYARRS